MILKRDVRTMLRGIHSAISPDLLKTLAKMGHVDEIVLANAHFRGRSMNGRVLRAGGLAVATLLSGILPLFALDACAPPLIIMAPVPGDTLDSAVEGKNRIVIRALCPDAPAPQRIDCFVFYERARTAYAVLVTGEVVKYGNRILKKGVTSPASL